MLVKYNYKIAILCNLLKFLDLLCAMRYYIFEKVF